MLNNFVDKIDASNMIGKTVAEYHYEPPMGLLTCPWEGTMNGLCSRDGEVKKANVLSWDRQTTSNDLLYNDFDGKQSAVHNKSQTYKTLTQDACAAVWSDYRYVNPIDCG